MGRKRNQNSNQHIGFVLSFVAGAINAGGFLAVHQYTSHMTGIVSAMADDVALGLYELALAGLGSLICFLAGATCSALMVNYSRRHKMHSKYALPILLEAVLLLVFGLLGAKLIVVEGLFISFTVMLLCFIMGLQNAVITKLSKSDIRTTHITGIITDIGIELGKLVYWNASKYNDTAIVVADRNRLMVLTLLAIFFFVGGVIGALGFNRLGYIATVPLSMILVVLTIIPVVDDVVVFIRRVR